MEIPRHVAVKQSVFPFAKFPGVDTILGPEMRSTGEVMGISDTFARAFYKSMLAAGLDILPADDRKRRVFISVKDEDKPIACIVGRRMRAAGYEICATRGTAAALARARIPCEPVNKVLEGHPHVVDAIRSGTIAMVVNTTIGAREVKDSYSLRRQTLLANIPYFTTVAAALAACDALEAARGDGGVRVRSLQEWGGLT
jgi:carbamoyl-phosphate synthase large subunit